MNPVDWALASEIAAPKKVLLVALAWMADDAGVTVKGQKTIAQRLGKDPRWVREHLPGLAAVGLISRYRRHRSNGSRTSDLIVVNFPREEPLDLSMYSGIVGDLEPGDQEPSGGFSPGGLAAEIRQPSGGNPPGHTDKPGDQPETKKTACARADAFPDDLPQELVEPAIAAGKILKSTAAQRGQKREVTRAAVGHAVLSYPDRDHVAVARRLQAWLLYEKGARRSCADIVARYRNFLDGAEPMAGPPLPSGVTPLYGGRTARPSAGEMLRKLNGGQT